MNIVSPKRLVKIDEPVSRLDQDVARPRRQSNFAREMMLAEFGKLGHLHDDQWRDHVDISAERLAQKRKLALWQETSS